VYIQTGLTASDARLYGPLNKDSDSLFSTASLPTGSYTSLYIIEADVAKPDLSPILVSDSCPTFASALELYANAAWTGYSALSFGVAKDVVVEGGKASSVEATLIPLSGETVDLGVAAARHILPVSFSGVSHRFIRLENIGVGIDPSLVVSKLACAITNLSAGSPQTVKTVALYTQEGSVVGVTSLSASPLASGQCGTLLADYPADSPRELFLYVEYKGSDLALTFDVMTVDSRTARFDYYVAGDDATGSGTTPSDPASLDAAMTAISMNEAITTARPAWIILTKNIVSGSASGYSITKPVKIVSVSEQPYAISFSRPVIGAYFTVGSAVSGVSGNLTLENARILGAGNSRRDANALVRVESGSFTMATGSELAENVSASGSAVTLAGNSASFTMNAGSIRDCSAPVAGAVNVGTGQFTMAGGVLSGCRALSGSGGAVLISGGSFSMLGGTIRDCAALDSGGAVALSGGIFSLEGGSIYGCSANSGGAVYASAGGRFILDGKASIGKEGSPNQATALGGTGGGGVALSGGASASLVSGSISYNEAAALGGGVFIDSGSTCAMSGGTIASNVASLLGGGVYLAGSLSLASPVASSAVIGGTKPAEGNRALQGGGAYVASGGELTVGERSQIWYNAAESSGGGAYVSSHGTLALLATGKQTIAYNQAGKIGGGVFLDVGATRVGPSSWHTAIMSNSTLITTVPSDILPDLARKRNIASRADLDEALKPGEEPLYAVLTSSVTCPDTLRVSSPIALGSSGSGIELSLSGMTGPLFSVSGGRLILCDDLTLSGKDSSIERSYPLVVVSDGSLALCDNARLVKNSNRYAALPGGGVYLDGGYVSLFGGSIGGQAASSGNASPAGAGLYIERGSLSLYGGSISYNRIAWTGALGGGGIYSRFGHVYLYGGTVDHNDASAPGAEGGGILAAGGLVKFMPCSTARISANAASSGGGVCLKGEADFQMGGGEIGGEKADEGNRATGNGGGILAAATNRAFTMAGGRVSHNRSEGKGGGIALEGLALSVTMNQASAVTNNSAVLSGGGMYFAKASVSACSVSDSIAIAGNHVERDRGLSCGAGVLIDSLPDVYAEFLNVQTSLSGNTDASSLVVVNITKIP
jgi:hypothetical protein